MLTQASNFFLKIPCPTKYKDSRLLKSQSIALSQYHGIFPWKTQREASGWTVKSGFKEIESVCWWFLRLIVAFGLHDEKHSGFGHFDEKICLNYTVNWRTEFYLCGIILYKKNIKKINYSTKIILFMQIWITLSLLHPMWWMPFYQSKTLILKLTVNW